MSDLTQRVEHERILSLPARSIPLTEGCPHLDLLNRIHSTDRTYTTTEFFGGVGDKSRVCVLDFLGLNQYFISEFGTVWNRSNIYPNKHRRLTHGYLPMVRLDTQHPTKWVKLPILGPDGCWVPIAMLLGWAFYPVAHADKYYATTTATTHYPLIADDILWSKTFGIDETFPSRYKSFVDLLYKGMPNLDQAA